jgi:hypothetical protein
LFHCSNGAKLRSLETIENWSFISITHSHRRRV